MKKTKQKGELSPKKNNGFTLVELVIVITILAILFVIAFWGYLWYWSISRDANRTSSLATIEWWLNLFYSTTGMYPFPDDEYGIWIISWDTLNHVGYAWDEIAQETKMNTVPQDPLYDEQYIYGISQNQKYYQIAWVFENESSFIPISQTYASDRRVKVKGNYQYPLRLNSKLRSLPSLLFVWNVQSNVTLDNTTIFMVDGSENIPNSYQESLSSDTKSTQELLKELTGTSITLTGISIPNDLTSEKLKSLSDNDFKTAFGNLWISRETIGRTLFWDKYFQK